MRISLKGEFSPQISQICTEEYPFLRNEMTESEISYEIRGAIFDVYNKLGPGLLESVYEMAMATELKRRGLRVERQVRIPVVYGDEVVEDAFRLDLLVEQKVIIELKSVLEMKNVFFLQLLTYLKLTGKHLGLLVNFNTDDIAHSIFRRIL